MRTAKHLENLATTSHTKMSADTGRLAKGEYQGAVHPAGDYGRTGRGRLRDKHGKAFCGSCHGQDDCGLRLRARLVQPSQRLGPGWRDGDRVPWRGV